MDWLYINASAVIGAGHGIVMNKDANILTDVHGETKLTNNRVKDLLRRLGFVKQKACSQSKINVEDFDKVIKDFLKTIVIMDEIPEELVITFDQTALNCVPATPWIMKEQGTKRIEVIGKGDKRQITAVFGGTMTGDFYHRN